MSIPKRGLGPIFELKFNHFHFLCNTKHIGPLMWSFSVLGNNIMYPLKLTLEVFEAKGKCLLSKLGHGRGSNNRAMI